MRLLQKRQKSFLSFCLFLSLFACLTVSSRAQITSRTAFRIRSGPSLPATCSPLAGDVFIDNSPLPSVAYWCTNTNTWTAFGTGAGTVTSVGLALPSIFTVSGSPVTTSGTLTGTLATQTANTIFAGPTTGAAAAPTFRAVVLADIPTAALGTGTPDGTKFLRDDRTFVTVTAGVTGTGTTNTITKFTNGAGGVIGNSLLTDDGTNVSLSSGKFLFPSGVTPSLAPTGSTTTGYGADGTHLYSFISGASIFQVVATGAFINSNTLTHGFFLGASGDVALSRDAADILAQRRSTNAQAFRLYNTFTDASNYERYGVRWSSNVLILGTENAGTGTARGMQITSATNQVDVINGTNSQTFSVYKTNASTTDRVSLIGATPNNNPGVATQVSSGNAPALEIGTFNSSAQFGGWRYASGAGGHYTPIVSNSYDVGASGALVHDLWMSNTTGAIKYGATSTDWLQRSGMSTPEVGLQIGDNTQNNVAFGIRTGDGTGTNQGGNSFVIAAGRGTGTGVPSYLRLRAGAMGTASGTTQHTNVDRMWTGATKTALTAGSANTIFKVALTSGSLTGGSVVYTVESTDGTSKQACSGRVDWAAANSAAVYTTNITAAPTETCAAESGTLADTWTITTGTNEINIRVTPTVTVITPTIVRITYTIMNHGESDVTIQ